MVLDDELRIVSASSSFYETFQVTPAEPERRILHVTEVGRKQWDIPSLRQLLGDILAKDTRFQDFRVEHNFPRHRTQGSHAQCAANGRKRRAFATILFSDARIHPIAHSAK